MHDQYGNVISQGDRWFVECSITIVPRPGVLTVVGQEAPNAPPVSLSARRGQAATGTFQLRNDGELPAEFKFDNLLFVMAAGSTTPQDVTVTPAAGSLGPGQSTEVQIPGAGRQPAGGHLSRHTDGTIRDEFEADRVAVAARPVAAGRAAVRVRPPLIFHPVPAFGEKLFQGGPDILLVVDLDQDDAGYRPERFLVGLAERGEAEGAVASRRSRSPRSRSGCT